MNNSDLKKINNVMESNTQEGMSWVKIAVKRKKEKNKERFKQYYQDNKEGLQEMVHDWFKKLSEEAKNKKTEYLRN